MAFPKKILKFKNLLLLNATGKIQDLVTFQIQDYMTFQKRRMRSGCVFFLKKGYKIGHKKIKKRAQKGTSVL